MRALRLLEKDQAPQIMEHPLPECRENHAIVQLRASALNRRDVWIKRGQYPGLRYPITLGSDGCGVVRQSMSGEGDDWVGQRVVLYPGFGWGDNPRIQAEGYRILGLPDEGTFAEYIHIPTENLHAAPNHLSDAEAAALPLAGLTAWRAVKTKGQVSSGMRVLVTGIGGGVAQMAALFAHHHGADVVVTSGDQSKIDRTSFAHGGVKYTEEDCWHQLRDLSPEGYDLIIDSAGGEGFGGLVRQLAPGGRLVFFGGTRGKWPQILPQHLFYKQVEILATTMGSPREFSEMLDFVSAQNIQPPIDHIFQLEDGAKAFDHLERGTQYGKVVLAH